MNHHNTDVHKISDQIRNIGHSDYFDAVIAACSLWYCDALITEDTDLKRRINIVNKDHNYSDHFEVLNWRELKVQLSK